jgi:hypothetical protein
LINHNLLLFYSVLSSSCNFINGLHLLLQAHSYG